MIDNAATETKSFVEVDGKRCYGFVVTGVLCRSNKRFRKEYPGTRQGWMTASGINLWNGTVWGLSEDGRRFKLSSTVN